MQIILVSSKYYPYVTGGAHISNKILIEGMKELGEKVEVFTLGENEIKEEINRVKVNRLYINRGTVKYLKEISFNLMEKIKYNLIDNLCIRNISFYKKINRILSKYPQGTVLHTSDVHLFYQVLWWKAAKKII